MDFETDYYTKLQETLWPLKSDDLDTLIAMIKAVKLPSLKRGSDEISKFAKEKINKKLKELKSITIYGYKENMKNDYKDTKNFPLVKQNPDYPNGCEVASATMLLNYAGIDIDMATYVDTFLPKEDVYEKNGVRYGPDPSEYYAGDPSDPKRGWGTFLPVIKNSIYSIFKEMLPEDTAGHVFTSNDKRPLEEYVQSGDPVLVWTTTDYTEAKEVYEWFSYDKSKTYTYPKNAHVVVVIGMDKNNYYINDPLKDEKEIKVPRKKFNKSYDSMGRQALFIRITDIYEPKNQNENAYKNN